MDSNTAPRFTARALAVLLWIAGSAYLVRAELGMPTPDWVVIATMPLIWAAVIALPILAHHAWKQGEYAAVALLSVAALVGSLFTLQGTIARQSEARDGKVAEAQASNFKRSELLEELGRAQKRYDDANKYADAERGTTCGPKCKDWERRAVEVKAYIDQTTSAIATLGADKPVASGEVRVAAAISLLPFVTADQAAVEKAVATFLPSLFGLFLELAALALAFFGWRPTGDVLSPVGSQDVAIGTDAVTRGSDPASQWQSSVTGDPDLAATTDTELARLRQWYFTRENDGVVDPTPPKPRKKANKRQQRRAKVGNWVREYTLENGRPPSFKVVKGRFHLPASTASRWRNEALTDVA